MNTPKDFIILHLHSGNHLAHETLLRNFYFNVVQPRFVKFPDELDPLETWTLAFQQERMHAIIAVGTKPLTNPTEPSLTLSPPTSPTQTTQDENTILGGLTCEYYPRSQTALLAYIAMSPQYEGKGVAKYLIHEMVASLPPCEAIFVETNDRRKVTLSQDIMDPNTRHAKFVKLGFHFFLDFEFVQPPLSPVQSSCDNMVLGVHNSTLKRIDEGMFGVRREVVQAFLVEYFECTMGEEMSRKDKDLAKMLDRLNHYNKEFLVANV